jgi:hypothetical protein
MINKFLNYILSVEGRNSSDPDDPASECYPGGIHTVNGITFCKWQKTAPKIGVSASHNAFVNMTNEQYSKILHLDYLNSQSFDGFWKLYDERPAIALLLIDWAYNRGNGGMEADLAKYQRDLLKLQDNDITIPEIMSNFRRSKWSDDALLISLFWRRLKRYKDIDDARRARGQKSYYKGWANRVKNYYKQFAPATVITELKQQGVVF